MYNVEKGLIALLPEIFSANESEKKTEFLLKYLRTIEKVFFKGDASGPRGLQEKLEKIPSMFHPGSALWSDVNEFNRHCSTNQKDFLKWLGSWFEFIPVDELDMVKNINVFSELISIYRIRGTAEGLKKACDLFSVGGGEVLVYDAELPLEGSAPIEPYRFHIVISLPSFNLVQMKEQKALMLKIIEKEKPVHVTYTVDFKNPSFQVEKQSNVGLDTLIG